MQLDQDGLVLDTTSEILADLETRVRDALQDEIPTGPEEPLGQLLAIQANNERLLQEAIGASYSATDRASATGILLDRIGALTGSTRLPARPSRVSVDVTTTGAVSLAPGALVIQVSGQPDRLFANEAQLTQGVTTGSHAFAALETGPIEAPAGTLTVIPIPVVNVSAVTNPADADLGADIETDTAYRVRQRQELARPASATVDGIFVDVLDGVLDSNGDRLIQDARVFENPTDAINGDGLPKHSIEVVIWDGDPPAATDTAIGQAVWNAKPGGIQAYGLTSTTATDSRGDSRAVAFTRAVKVRLVIEVTLEAGPSYSAGTESRIQSGVASYWEERQRIGASLIRSQLYDAVWDSVEVDEEVIDIISIEASGTLGSPPAPPDPVAAANVTIGVREIGVLAASDVTVLTV